MGSCTMEKCAVLLSVLVLVWTPLGKSAEVPDYCKLFPDNGPGPSCLAYIPQFFYNSTSQECEEFIYGGCGGNENRFDSKKKCMETCSAQPSAPTRAGKVTPHTFSRTKTGPEECVGARSLHRTKNACDQEPEAGPCLGYFPHFFYNATSGKCEIFIYGGCGGNPNRFKSLTICQMYCRAVPQFNATEVCNLAPETGPCKAAFPQLYYNPQSQRCEPFIYGGCEGNDNRFESIENCMRICHPGGSDVITPLVSRVGQRVNACNLPPETGRCRAHIPRFFYNSTTNKCEKFIYGGCGGNNNRFVSARECHLNCHQKVQQPTETPGTDPTETCLQPSETGPCHARIPRYYYNQETKTCDKFYYGGCKGNQNNFVNEEKCMKKCKKD